MPVLRYLLTFLAVLVIAAGPAVAAGRCACAGCGAQACACCGQTGNSDADLPACPLCQDQSGCQERSGNPSATKTGCCEADGSCCCAQAHPRTATAKLPTLLRTLDDETPLAFDAAPGMSIAGCAPSEVNHAGPGARHPDRPSLSILYCLWLE